jgi:UDP:flavonoid glycosyltransferase YjiC (YdhE family)
VILISDGTIDNRDSSKLIVPVLEALNDSGALLIVGTGHRNTAALRRAFLCDNIVVEGVVDFGPVLEHADVVICNGGFGSVLLALSKRGAERARYTRRQE